MSTNLTDVTFDEGEVALVVFATAIDGFSGADAETLQLLPGGAHFTWVRTTGEAPDPVTTTRYTWFVPYSNIKAIKQSVVI